ncbi:MAG: hypothetical protein L0Z51_11490 [Candidatus Latescibacteria bacterium]|nr:hypothetical protein [Candidatus Latescibacterota bacterium]
MKSSIVVVLLLLAGPSTASDVDSTRTDARAGVSDLGYAPLSQGLLLSKYVSRYHTDATAPALLTISLNPFAPQGYVPPTRFDAMLLGAGTAGTLALFVGAIGNTLGAFDEDTTWIMTGAAAAAGALYSGSRFKVRLGPDDSPRPPSDR